MKKKPSENLPCEPGAQIAFDTGDSGENTQDGGPEQTAPDFESAIGELEMILDRLSAEGATLDESITLYARAAELIKTCNQALRAAKLRVDEITATVRADGVAEGFDDI